MLKKTVFFIALFYLYTIAFSKPLTIMIDPAGDAQYTGRRIEEIFERGLTLEYAQAVKQALESKNIRVILTRSEEESVEILQNAAFANRLQVDFYFSIHFYYQQEGPAEVSLYYLIYNTITDSWHKPAQSLVIYPFYKAYLINNARTVYLATALSERLKRAIYLNQFSFQNLLGLPVKPLIGIYAPALVLEIGLKNKEDWKRFVEPIAESISTICTN
jgi:N-acetylmuramoyl-L-alanine amidase